VALASEIGVPVVADLLRRAGITTLDKNATHYGLGLTLGNAEVRLDELVRAYARFAGTSTRSLISERTKFWISDILADPEARRYIFGEGSSLDFPFVVAAKTGTSQAYHDNWTIGYTRDVTVGVWVGNLDRTPLRFSSGVTGAGPIFHDVMLAAVEHARGALPLFDTTPIHAAPADLRERDLCAESGMTAGASCPARVREFLPATVDGHLCTWHHPSDRGVVTVYPEPYRAWATYTTNTTNTTHPTYATPTTHTTNTTNPTLSITSPPSGATYLIDPTLRPDFQSLSLRAQGGIGRIEWLLNGQSVGATLGDTPLTWPLTRGTHTITARDANGRRAESQIVVK
jgi:penicillin-binding protein 1C